MIVPPLLTQTHRQFLTSYTISSARWAKKTTYWSKASYHR